MKAKTHAKFPAATRPTILSTLSALPFFVVLIVVAPSTRLPLLAQESKTTVTYGAFGAVGDGVTDDFEAVVKTHAAANASGWNVRADAGAKYYIGAAKAATKEGAIIQTDTDWGDAEFIIDDSKVDAKNRSGHVFRIRSKLPAIQITTVETLRKNQEKLDLSLPGDSFIEVVDRDTKRYIRYGLNQNEGSAQTDVFVVDKDGNVDGQAPVIWNFENISSMRAYPIDPETLTVRGGRFTTIANRAESRYDYYARGIHVARSNVVIDGIRHAITGELDHGAPYGGFLTISGCTAVTVRNCMLSGHKTYVTIGSAGKPVSMGSYDISVNKSTNVRFEHCKQINDIHDTKLWGIFGSNYSKNITFDTVEFSRFDAHMGVANATIKNSILGHQGINIIGCGVFLIENTKVCGGNFISLRGDYGSTFEGEFVVRNCVFAPRGGARSDTVLIGGSNSGQHDFGYPCFMPKKVTIDGLVIHDVNPVNNYRGPRIFASFNSAYTNDGYVEKYPYAITEELEIGNLTVESGKPWSVSDNPFLFRNLKVTEP